MIIVSLIAYPQFLTQLNIIDFVKMLPGILLQSAGFYCAIASVKYGKISITSSIKRARVVIIIFVRNYYIKRKLYNITINIFYYINNSFNNYSQEWKQWEH